MTEIKWVVFFHKAGNGKKLVVEVAVEEEEKEKCFQRLSEYLAYMATQGWVLDSLRMLSFQQRSP